MNNTRRRIAGLGIGLAAVTMISIAPIYAQDTAFEVEDAERFHRLVPRDARVETLSDELKNIEGAVWVGGDDGYLIFSQMTGSRLVKWTPDGGFETFRAKHQSNGNAVDRQERIISCEHGKRRVARVEANGEPTPIAETFEGKRFNSPNDVVVKSDGTIWFTDPRYGEWFGPAELDGNYVYRVAEDGAVTVATKDLSMPNGLCFSPDEKILYIGQGGRGAFIRAYEVAGDGTLTNGRKFCRIRHGAPDGLRCDTEGHLYVTGDAGVEIWTPEGKYLGTIKTQPRPANCAFGGPGRKWLFIAAHHCLFKIELNAAGASWPNP